MLSGGFTPCCGGSCGHSYGQSSLLPVLAWVGSFMGEVGYARMGGVLGFGAEAGDAGAALTVFEEDHPAG